jgi:type IV pilus assembly protein PilA
MNHKGFSIIELLVVIAIIGVLAAIAVPAYTTYQIKTKITKSLIVVDAIAHDALNYYTRRGVFPSSIVVNGVTIPNVSWAVVNYGAIKAIAYEGSSSGIMLNFSITGLDGIPSYVTPTDATYVPSGGRSVMAYSIKDLGNGVTKTACGQYNPPNAADAIPFTYLPPNCTCASIFTFYTNGTGC